MTKYVTPKVAQLHRYQMDRRARLGSAEFKTVAGVRNPDEKPTQPGVYEEFIHDESIFLDYTACKTCGYLMCGCKPKLGVLRAQLLKEASQWINESLQFPEEGFKDQLEAYLGLDFSRLALGPSAYRMASPGYQIKDLKLEGKTFLPVLSTTRDIERHVTRWVTDAMTPGGDYVVQSRESLWQAAYALKAELRQMLPAVLSVEVELPRREDDLTFFKILIRGVELVEMVVSVPRTYYGRAF